LAKATKETKRVSEELANLKNSSQEAIKTKTKLTSDVERLTGELKKAKSTQTEVEEAKQLVDIELSKGAKKLKELQDQLTLEKDKGVKLAAEKEDVDKKYVILKKKVDVMLKD